MPVKKLKPVYTVTASDNTTASAVYSCLKTLCQEWGQINHYSTIWKWLRDHDTPYQDSGITITKHKLIKAEYKRN